MNGGTPVKTQSVVVYTATKDSREAGLSLGDQINAQLGGTPPDAVILFVSPQYDAAALVACVVELMSSNFEAEAKIDDEADRMAEEQARLDTRLDVTRLRGMIRQRLAEKKGFTL